MKPGTLNLRRNPREVLRYLVLSAPLAGPLYLRERKGHRVEPWEQRLDTFGLWPVSVGFGIGTAALVWFFVRWLRTGRNRDGWHVTVGMMYVAVGVLMLWMGSTNAYETGPRFDELVDDPTLHLIPVWSMILLGGLTIVYQMRSPKPQGA
jgi:hypothetical protein